MRRTSVAVLGLITGVTAVVGALFLRYLESRGVYLASVAWVEDVAMLVLAVAIFWSGWAVRAYQKGDRPGLDPLRAARTFVLAKAGALTGALLAGRYLASVFVVLGQLDIEARRDDGIAAAIGAVCAIVLAVVGLVVERFCEIPPPSDGEGKGTRESAGPLPS